MVYRIFHSKLKKLNKLGLLIDNSLEIYHKIL